MKKDFRFRRPALGVLAGGLFFAMIALGSMLVNSPQSFLAEYLSTGRPANSVRIVAAHPDGTVFFDQTVANLRTNAGANWQADIMAKTSAPPVNAQCNYLGLSNDAGGASATHTALASEIIVNGLARAQGTYNHTADTSTYTVAHQWTATGAQSAQLAGTFTAAGPPVAGTMCFENTFTPVSLQTNDTLTLTWTVNF